MFSWLLIAAFSRHWLLGQTKIREHRPVLLLDHIGGTLSSSTGC